MSSTGYPVPPSALPTLSAVSATDYVVVESSGEFYKVSLLVWASAAIAELRYTATELSDAGNAVNTTNKFLGKWVFDTTNGIPVYAAGGDTTSVWKKFSDDSTAHTPS